MRLSSGARYAGGVMFLAGVLMLGFAIYGLIPDGTGAAYTSEMFSKFILDIGMLLVSTFMIAIGMFFVAYGGQHNGAERNADEWTE